MSEVKTVATRAAYGQALVDLGKKRDDFVVLDADLAAATQTGKFKKEFPYFVFYKYLSYLYSLHSISLFKNIVAFIAKAPISSSPA